MKKLPTPLILCVLALVPGALMLSACSTPGSFAKDSFSNDSPYQKHVSASAKIACSAAERTLLGDGYTLDSASAKMGTIKGRKAYRMDGGRSSFLEMSVVCLPDTLGSTIYASGLISTYDLKKSANAASVGLSVIGSISLPIGQTVDSMVKVSDETITDRVFYKRFFASVEGVLGDANLDVLPAAPKVPTSASPVPPASTLMPMPASEHQPVSAPTPVPVAEPPGGMTTSPVAPLPQAGDLAQTQKQAPDAATPPTEAEKALQPSANTELNPPASPAATAAP
jgi:hypothetical protein